MTKSRIQRLRNMYNRFTSGEGNVDKQKLLSDLIDYQKRELERSFADTSIQSDQNHNRLVDDLEKMINTLKPSENEGQRERLF